LLNHLRVDVIAGLLGDVYREGGSLLVDDVFVSTDQFEDAGELGEGDSF